MERGVILIIDDEIEMCRSLQDVLEDRGWSCTYTTRPAEALELVHKIRVDACIMDVRMPDMGGIQLLEQVKSRSPELPILMITGYPNMTSAVTAMRLGALNVFAKPLDIDALTGELAQIIERRRTAHGEQVHVTGAPASRSDRVRAIEATATKVARTGASVLITGESGTGKERIAAQIHTESQRAHGPFVKINCAAIPASLLESELFGHEKGAFTGAHRARKGSFESAHTGTIFLDEIGDMSLDLQAKILRVVQEREFERVGGGHVRIDSRFVSATNRDLLEMVRNGTFREDLYYRLAVVTIDMIPLRERADDIESLFTFFLDHYRTLYGTTATSVDPEVHRVLHRHDWPGNIRELKNLAERTAIFADTQCVRVTDLPPQYRNPRPCTEKSSYASASENFDRRIIREALSQAEGNRKRAAELLQIHRKTLYNKMRKLGLE